MSGIDGSCGNSTFHVIKHCPAVFYTGRTLPSPPALSRESHFLHILVNTRHCLLFVSFFFFNDSHPSECVKGNLAVVLIGISPMTNDVRASFHVLVECLA